jgi:CBS domain containing-hemolysin-like protein
MVPRSNVKGIPVSASYEEVKAAFKSDMYTRVPVYDNDLDTIVGILNFKELLRLEFDEISDFNVLKIMQQPLFVPENVTIGELLERMKALRRHMAVVVDEFGSTSGIATFEDLVERVFGMINDEYDGETQASLYSMDNGEYEVAGNISLQELGNALSLEFSDEERRNANTLNGLLVYMKGDFLKEKDIIPRSNHLFIIKSMDGHVAEQVLIKKKTPSKTESVMPSGTK